MKDPGTELFRALQAKILAEKGIHLTTEDFVLSLMSDGDDTKREEIFDRMAKQYGKEFDNSSMRSLIDQTLKKLCEDKVIKSVGHGIYEYNF